MSIKHQTVSKDHDERYYQVFSQDAGSEELQVLSETDISEIREGRGQENDEYRSQNIGTKGEQQQPYHR